ncbi:MAG: alpha amylase C-terminal domain-containing protein [Pseudomonadota bacterium]
MSDFICFDDPYLAAYEPVIVSRQKATQAVEMMLKDAAHGSLYAFCDYHHLFGLHLENNGWQFREWAPNAREIYILCDQTSWQKHDAFKLEQHENGIFERFFDRTVFSHQDLYRLKIVWQDGEGDRIPTAATRVVQDLSTLIFNAQVWLPDEPYQWKIQWFVPSKNPLLIYETHVGMALEEGRVGTYCEFEHHILPKIIDAGYTAIQLMAVQEHPYYGSFGYHVSSFFAPSSRFGSPDELKSLIDAAHKANIRVLMDIIHSHAVNNEVEGISRFDGSHYQFFHDGPKGYHRQWDSRCFDYGKIEVLKFLLSNIRYWIEEFKVDGFRFDGITSMLFEDHGLGRAFTSYKDYFQGDLDVDALSYLTLANRVAHDINPECITIAEDVSGYPGLAGSLSEKGVGFDYRYAMGIADFWIKLLKDMPDEHWHMGTLWYELTSKRREEKTISYAESHDQALVGDQTIMMRLMGDTIYTAMEKTNTSVITNRAVALHKMIRLITATTADSGYLNFMGNEFGHPEWVDFPSHQNHFAYDYARRQWSLKYNEALYYSSLFDFDKIMIDMIKSSDLFTSKDMALLRIHEDDKLIAFKRGDMVFVFNFHPGSSFTDYMFDAPPGEYQMLFNSDEKRFGGLGRLKSDQTHHTLFDKRKTGESNLLSLYIPSRTAIVLKLKTAIISDKTVGLAGRISS